MVHMWICKNYMEKYLSEIMTTSHCRIKLTVTHLFSSPYSLQKPENSCQHQQFTMTILYQLCEMHITTTVTL